MRKLKCVCIVCGKERFYYGGQGKGKYCSYICQQKEQRNKIIEKWKLGIYSGISGVAGKISKVIRDYLFNKFDSKCCKCSWNTLNEHTQKIPLQVNHIDGDYQNNNEDNLELLCPNCHSLTDNFGGANRGKGRKYRYGKLLEGK